MSRFRALVVHAQPVALRELVELLSSSVLRVETAQSAAEALAKMASRDYALLLVADCPPLLDGPALLERSLALVPDVLRLLLTSTRQHRSEAVGRQGPHRPVIRLASGTQGRDRLLGVVRECVELLGLLAGQRTMMERFDCRPEAHDAPLDTQERYQALLDPLIERGGPVFDELGDLYAQLRTASGQALFALVEGIERKDPYTQGHCGRVAAYTLALAQEIGFSDEALEILELGAFLHDIGKIGIRDDVLLKPGPLDEQEWQHMRDHVLLGCEIISKIDMLAPTWPAVRSHHERWDGSGYPDGLRGESIPLVGRLVAIADAYDAMATDRPYKSALPLEECERLLRRTAGSMYDPELVDIFTRRRIGALYRPDYDDLDISRSCSTTAW